jgi:membrane associated rhomboid family serine protease
LIARPVSLSESGSRADGAQTRLDGVRVEQAREPIFNVPPVVVVLILAICLVHFVRELILPDNVDELLVWTFAFVPARYDTGVLADNLVPGGRWAEYWSFMTYALIHADLTHLGFNAIWLLAFGSPVAFRFGPMRFLAFFAASVSAGALAHLFTHPGAFIPMVGASAAISGTMGAATRFAFEPGGPLDVWRRNRIPTNQIPAAPLGVALRNPRVIAFLAVWFGLNLLFGLGSVPIVAEGQSIAWEAHVGGFLAGLLLFSAFDPIEPREI